MKPEILLAGLLLTALWAVLLVRTEKRTLPDALGSAARMMGAPVVGVFALSALPPQFVGPALVAILIAVFLVGVARGYVRAGQDERP